MADPIGDAITKAVARKLGGSSTEDKAVGQMLIEGDLANINKAAEMMQANQETWRLHMFGFQAQGLNSTSPEWKSRQKTHDLVEAALAKVLTRINEAK